jgi:ubiquinone/menaquinone biosynthesis C-methylase UbiE
VKSTRALYRRAARWYDPVAAVWEGIRRAALRGVEPMPGGVVLDLACGTGLSFARLLARAAPARLVGVDRSGAMLAVARRRTADPRVALVASAAEALPLPDASVDLVFCCLAHDVVASEAAMREAVRVLRPGGRLVLAGVKLVAGGGRSVLNPLVRLGARLALATPLSSRPWHHAAARLGPLAVVELRLGTAYVAVGRRGA